MLLEKLQVLYYWRFNYQITLTFILELIDIQNERERKVIDQALEDEKSILDYQEGIVLQ
jgi:hypothetical protein